MLWKIIKSAIDSLFPTSEWGFYPLTNTSYNVTQLTRTDYIRLYTGWQYVAVSTIANSVAELDYVLTKNGDATKPINHPHMDLVCYKLLQTIVSSLQLTGSAYLRKVYIGKKIDELQFLRTDQVQIEENTDGSVKYYWYSGKTNYYRFTPEEIIDLSLYSPYQTRPQQLKGVSPMQAVAMQAEMDQTANRWNWSFFKNNASVGWVLKTDKSLSQEVKERIARKRKNKFQWVNNSSNVAVLDNGVEYQDIKVSQREMDFVESRRFTRDEVFAIFKLPKSIVWVADDVNRASATVAENTFYRVCIRPLAVMIEESFTEHLFKWVGNFTFTGVVPVDVENLLKEYEAWAITWNEYRQATWRDVKSNGDFLKVNPMMVDTNTQYKQLNVTSGVLSQSIQKTINKNIYWTKENTAERERVGELQRKAKILRTDRYEEQYIKEVQKIFQEQWEMLVEQVLSQKTKSVKNPKFNILENVKRVVALKGIYDQVFKTEGDDALWQLWAGFSFNVWVNRVNDRIRDSILHLSKEVNNTTKETIIQIIKDGNNDWLWAEAIARNISKKFEDFSKKRAETIARTEITRASNEAMVQAWEQSWVVSGKQRYTALDERVCPECNAMHMKTVGLRDEFIKQGDTQRGVTYDYEDVNHPPLHPNCRCTLLSIIN